MQTQFGIPSKPLTRQELDLVYSQSIQNPTLKLTLQDTTVRLSVPSPANEINTFIGNPFGGHDIWYKAWIKAVIVLMQRYDDVTMMTFLDWSGQYNTVLLYITMLDKGSRYRHSYRLENIPTRYGCFIIVTEPETPDTNTPPHASACIIDTKYEEIAVIDPNGTTSSRYKYEVGAVNDLIRDTPYEHYTIVTIPSIYIQHLDEFIGKPLELYQGYCALWTIFMFEAVGKNPDMRLSEIIREAPLAVYKKYGSARNFIERYSTKLENLVLKSV
jgi:hypothetical protein